MAIGLVAAILLLKLLLARVFGPDSPFILFPVSVLLAAWYAGLGPGLLAAALSTAAAAFFFIQPIGSLEVGNQRIHEVLVYGAEAFLFCWLAASLRKQQLHLSISHGRLESELAGRIHVEERLRQSEHHFRELADAMPQLVWTARPDGTVDYYNARYQHFGGIRPSHDGTWEWSPVLHPEDSAPTIAAWQYAVRTGVPYEVAHRIRCADGEYRWHLSRGVPAYDASGTIIRWYGTATNIDGEKRVQIALQEREIQLQQANEMLEARVRERTDEIRRLASELTLAEQHERRRISQILHDDLQQLLYAMGMHLELVAMDLPQHPREQLVHIRRIVEDALMLTRRLTVDLSPPLLEGEGLEIALQWLARQMKEVHGLEVELHTRGASRVPRADVRVFLFQIVRELLFNVVKHAGVKHVRVELLEEASVLVIRIEDEGQGFDVEEAEGRQNLNGGFGLFSARERMKFFQGALEVDSAPGRGTRITVRMPTRYLSGSPHDRSDAEAA